MTRNALVQPLRNEEPGYNENVNNIAEPASSVFIVKGSHLLLAWDRQGIWAQDLQSQMHDNTGYSQDLATSAFVAGKRQILP